jgi:hypothetical protein
VTPIFKKGRRNNVEDNRGVAILSATLALWRTDLRWRTCWSTLPLCWIQFKKDGRWIPFTQTFSKAFGRVRHKLLLEKMSVGIKPTLCVWLGSCLTGRMQRIRISEAVSKDIRCPKGESSWNIVFNVLSAEYRWFSSTSVCCSTPMMWSCFFPLGVFRTVWRFSRILPNCPSGARKIHYTLRR